MIMIDIDMPDNCEECRFNMESGFCKAMPDNFCGYTDDRKRPEWCPLKEKEAVEPSFKQGEGGIFVWCCGSCGAYMYHIYDGIDKAKEYAKYCRKCGKPVKWAES